MTQWETIADGLRRAGYDAHVEDGHFEGVCVLGDGWAATIGSDGGPLGCSADFPDGGGSVDLADGITPDGAHLTGEVLVWHDPRMARAITLEDPDAVAAAVALAAWARGRIAQAREAAEGAAWSRP